MSDDAAHDNTVAAQWSALQQELRRLQADLADIGLPVTAIDEIATADGICRVRDILRQAFTDKAALRISEDKYHLLFESMIDAFCSVDMQGNFREFNPAYLALLGYTADELRHLTYQDLTPDTWHPTEAAIVAEQVLPHGYSQVYEKEYRRKDGSLLPVELRTFLLRDANGQPDGMWAIVRDISERKRAETQVTLLHRSVEEWAAEMDATIAAIADGIIIYGPNAAIRRLNGVAQELLGYTPDITALPCFERVKQLHVEDADGKPLSYEEQPPWRALQGETIQGLVLTFTRADGLRRWISVSAAPIPSSHGKVIGAVATLSDITPMRELQQRQNDLLHIVSHDLRVPLTVIQGHIELIEAALQRRHIDGELALNTSTIIRNIRRMDIMIQDLVDMAGLEGQQFTLFLDDIYLQSYVPDLFARLVDILPIHRVVTDLPSTLPAVRADADRLERILLNLLTNAFKYSAPDTPVRLQAEVGKGEVIITITDQGRGINPAYLPHLFERFFRAGGDRKADGIGLGLYITKLLVEMHGGRLWVESTVGTGSSFSFTLPLATCASSG